MSVCSRALVGVCSNALVGVGLCCGFHAGGVCRHDLVQPSDAVVVDYTNALGKFRGHAVWRFETCPSPAHAGTPGRGPPPPPQQQPSVREGRSAEGGAGEFGSDDNSAALVAPVSWHGTQRLYVYRKVRVCDT
jgi:hypothetical protein